MDPGERVGMTTPPLTSSEESKRFTLSSRPSDEQMNVWERISGSGRSLIEQGHLVDKEEALAFPAEHGGRLQDQL